MSARLTSSYLLLKIENETYSLCPACGEEMKIISAITSPHQDDVFETMLKATGQWPSVERCAPLRSRTACAPPGPALESDQLRWCPASPGVRRSPARVSPSGPALAGDRFAPCGPARSCELRSQRLAGVNARSSLAFTPPAPGVVARSSLAPTHPGSESAGFADGRGSSGSSQPWGRASRRSFPTGRRSSTSFPPRTATPEERFSTRFSQHLNRARRPSSRARSLEVRPQGAGFG
jgi:hypothetical protein